MDLAIQQISFTSPTTIILTSSIELAMNSSVSLPSNDVVIVLLEVACFIWKIFIIHKLFTELPKTKKNTTINEDHQPLIKEFKEE